MEAIQESLNEMMGMFTKKMDAFERQASKPSTPSSDCNRLAADFAVFKEFVITSLRALQTQIEVLAKQSDQQEMRARRKILLLHGVPEQQREDSSQIVTKTLAEQLKICVFKAEDISRCHRMGRVSSPDKPRPILFKLRDVTIRSKIWAAKKTLKGSGITLSEFLTKPRHDLFMAARERFGVTKCWTSDGFVYVLGPDGARRRVSSVSEFDEVTGKSTSEKHPEHKYQASTSASSRSRRYAAAKK